MSRVDLSPGYVFPINFPLQLLLATVLGLVLAMLGFSLRQQADLRARWRIGVAAVELVAAGWLGSLPAEDTASKMIYFAVWGLGGALVVFFASMAMEWSVRRVAPARFSSFVRLFDRRAASESCGLAILRGTFLGLALLGADTFLVWLGTRYLAMRLDPVWRIFLQSWRLLSTPWPSAHIVLTALVHFVRRFWRAAFFALALAAATFPGPFLNLGAVQPYHWKVLLLLFDCLVSVWAFHRFDVLTVVWTPFTFACCWQNYFRAHGGGRAMDCLCDLGIVCSGCRSRGLPVAPPGSQPAFRGGV